MTIQNPLDHTRLKGESITTNKIDPSIIRRHDGYPQQPEPERSYLALFASILPFIAILFTVLGHFYVIPAMFVLALVAGLASITLAVLSLRETL